MRKARLFASAMSLGLLVLSHTISAQQALDPVTLPAEFLALEHPRMPAELVAARDESLRALAELLSHGAPERFGFKTVPSLGGPDGLQAADPLPEAVVQLSDIKQYLPTQDAAKLVKVLERRTFPLVLHNQVFSSMTLAKTGTTAWKAVSFGAPNLIRAAMAARLIAPGIKRPGSPQPLLNPGNSANYTIIRVTGLNHIFLGAEGNPPGPLSGKILYLVPLFSVARLGFTKGVPVLASEVFIKLKPEALAHNGQPT